MVNTDCSRPHVAVVVPDRMNFRFLRAGGDALAFLQSHCTRECVDSEKLFVMLLDVGIPTLSGLEVVKQCPKPLPFPIVAMTGTVDVDSVEQYRWW
jgi:CheY-like chemotaxis protein